MATSEEKLQALLKDLQDLTDYLHSRGDKTLKLARQFEAHVRVDPTTQDFDLSQARMLGYQHDIWHEIGNMVEKLIKQYEH